MMDWLRKTIYPPTESNTWTDTLKNVLKTSAESLLTIRDVLMELIKVYLAPVFHLIVQQIKTIFQILVDNFYRHLLPFLSYFLGEIRTFAVYLFDFTASLCQNCLTTASDVVQFLNYHSTIVLANCIQLAKLFCERSLTWLLYTYNYFSLFPTYKLYLMVVIIFLMVCCFIMLVNTCRNHKRMTSQLQKETYEDKNESLVPGDSNGYTANGKRTKGIYKFKELAEIGLILNSKSLVNVGVYVNICFSSFFFSDVSSEVAAMDSSNRHCDSLCGWISCQHSVGICETLPG